MDAESKRIYRTANIEKDFAGFRVEDESDEIIITSVSSQKYIDKVINLFEN